MLLEVCVDRIDSAIAADQAVAHWLELCVGLSVGGITPSQGLIEQCRDRCGCDLMIMIRPHDGTFCYASDDLDTMLRDIRLVKRSGARGVVWGALTGDGRVDVEACRRLLEVSRPLEVTFHRAFDLTRDPREAVETLLDLGVDRLLTSGQATSAERGLACIRKLVETCGERLSVMPGAGISAANVRRIVDATRVREVHASASVVAESRGKGRALGFGHSSRLTDGRAVAEILAAIGE